MQTMKRPHCAYTYVLMQSSVIQPSLQVDFFFILSLQYNMELRGACGNAWQIGLDLGCQQNKKQKSKTKIKNLKCRDQLKGEKRGKTDLYKHNSFFPYSNF